MRLLEEQRALLLQRIRGSLRILEAWPELLQKFRTPTSSACTLPTVELCLYREIFKRRLRAMVPLLLLMVSPCTRGILKRLRGVRLLAVPSPHETQRRLPILDPSIR